jgi:hypothetical protein
MQRQRKALLSKTSGEGARNGPSGLEAKLCHPHPNLMLYNSIQDGDADPSESETIIAKGKE